MILLGFFLVLGVLELATIKSIRRPKSRKFASTRLAATQYQTVFMPALGALASGFFVSLAASFFFAGLPEDSESWYSLASVVTFLLGAVVLVTSLWSLLTDAGDPARLARDPFTIRAAAEEVAANPRGGGLDPEMLTRQLDRWEEFAAARAMDLSVDVTSQQLDHCLVEAAAKNNVWLSLWWSVRVFGAASVRFPFRFGWPALASGLFIFGSVWQVLTRPGREGAWLGSIIAVLILVVIGLFPSLFYGAMRGNRARLWHRINLEALNEAREAINAADVAFKSVAAEDARLQRLLLKAERFFRGGGGGVSAPTWRTVVRFGRLRVTVSE